MSRSKPMTVFTIALGMLCTAPLASADQYQYQDAEGRLVVTQQLPPVGVSYAVLDEEGVYRHLVPAMPRQLQPSEQNEPQPRTLDQVVERSLQALVESQVSG